MKEDTSQEFVRWFQQATGYKPYPFQMRFACAPLPKLVNVPTGLGKTAMAVLGWLWRGLESKATVNNNSLALFHKSAGMTVRRR